MIDLRTADNSTIHMENVTVASLGGTPALGIGPGCNCHIENVRVTTTAPPGRRNGRSVTHEH